MLLYILKTTRTAQSVASPRIPPLGSIGFILSSWEMFTKFDQIMLNSLRIITMPRLFPYSPIIRTWLLTYNPEPIKLILSSWTMHVHSNKKKHRFTLDGVHKDKLYSRICQNNVLSSDIMKLAMKYKTFYDVLTNTEPLFPLSFHFVHELLWIEGNL